MNGIICFDEFSQKEDTIYEKVNVKRTSLNTSLNFIMVFFGLKNIYKGIKVMLESSLFHKAIKGASSQEIKKTSDGLENILVKNELIQQKLIEIIRIFPQPLLKSSLKYTQDIDDLLRNSLENIQIAQEPKFIKSIGRVLEGIEKSEFDINKVKEVDSIF